MDVYFVRHGQTYLNALRLHQSPSTPLSPEGRIGALSVGEHLRGVNPDMLITSEYTRALETARIIGLHVGLTPQVNGLFYELMRPSRLFGKSHFHIETLWYVFLSVVHSKNPKWRYNDAENFGDITKRAQKALVYLESLHGTHNSVIVVSHAIFINILVSYLCRERMLNFRDLLSTFLDIKRMKNTEVVHLRYTKSNTSGTCAWERIPGTVL